jgi:16S rRNA (uracil1498-N3)-methyltransferase
MSAPRLYLDQPLGPRARPAADPAQAHYLLNVLRLKAGDQVLLFNGRDGEWRASVSEPRKRACTFDVGEQTRPQTDGPDIDYLFAPIKRARLDYMAQKATELGVASMRPVTTARTVAERVNLDRLRANAIEAAEQCGVLRVPELRPPLKLGEALAGLDEKRSLVFCDEAAPVTSPLDALSSLREGPIALLIGPEGGFAPEERAVLLAQRNVTPISLGPRIMRADTAAIAALALINAAIGDWR